MEGDFLTGLQLSMSYVASRCRARSNHTKNVYRFETQQQFHEDFYFLFPPNGFSLRSRGGSSFNIYSAGEKKRLESRPTATFEVRRR